MKERILIRVIIIVLIVFVVNNYMIESYRVVGSSMEPTYKDGDLLIISKIKSKSYGRNDVVILYKNDRAYIKRIVGLPNERLSYINNSLLINGNLENGMYKDSIEDFETIIKPDSYFVLGDNRNFSSDSRDFGEVKKEEIIGKVVFRYLNYKNNSK